VLAHACVNQTSEDPSLKPSGGRIGEGDMDYDTDINTMAALRRRLRYAQDNYSRYKTYSSLAPPRPPAAAFLLSSIFESRMRTVAS